MPLVTECPACGAQRSVPVVALDDGSRSRFLEYSRAKYAGLLDPWMERLTIAIDRCDECGHHWYRDQPDAAALAAMYDAGRFLIARDERAQRSATPEMRSEMRRVRRLVRKDRPRMLDYGSGLGRWARAAVAEGFQVTAFEPSAGRGKERDEVPFKIVQDLAAAGPDLYDVVNFEQVLEHLPDPASALRGVRPLFADNAYIRITVPNLLRCPEGTRIWRDWPYDGIRVHTMAPFEHLHGFTPRSLVALVSRSGLKPAAGARVWRAYPIEQARRILGRALPAIDTTLLIAQHAPQPCRSETA